MKHMKQASCVFYEVLALFFALSAFGKNTADAVTPSGLVYVESNTPAPEGNSILAFRRDDAGNLSPVPGSPFATGGAGVGNMDLVSGQRDSDQNLVLSSDGTRLFAVNSGSNDVSVFNILSDGGLVPVQGSPFPSNGFNPVSVGLAGNYLYVAHKGVEGGLPSYTGLLVSADGRLAPVFGATIEVPVGSSPSQALVAGGGSFLMGADFGSGLLQSFDILADGALAQHTPQSLPVDSVPLGLQEHPNQPLIYVGFVSTNELGVYSYDDAGDLTFLRAVENSGRAICWIALNSAGTCLYTSNTGDNSISSYNLADASRPVEIQRTVFESDGGPFQIGMDSTSTFLYVVSQPFGPGANTLHVLRADASSCLLAEVPTSPLRLPVPDDTRAQGIAAN